jgi:hypothetical protein
MGYSFILIRLNCDLTFVGIACKLMVQNKAMGKTQKNGL